MSVDSHALELTARLKPKGRIKVRDRVRVRLRVRVSVSISLNKNNLGVGELTDKYPPVGADTTYIAVNANAHGRKTRPGMSDFLSVILFACARIGVTS